MYVKRRGGGAVNDVEKRKAEIAEIDRKMRCLKYLIFTLLFLLVVIVGIVISKLGTPVNSQNPALTPVPIPAYNPQVTFIPLAKSEADVLAEMIGTACMTIAASTAI